MAHIAEQEEAVNADSFLDIVASVVSVMIIMVMMTGLKIKNTPPEALPTSEVARAGGDLVQKQHEEQTLRGDVEKIATEMEQVQTQTAMRERERDILVLAVTGLDQQLRGARQTAAQQPPPDGQLAAKVVDARNRLEILNRQREAIEKSPAQSVQIESFTTPLGRTVDGREVHFQLSHGRIAYVPLNELVEKADGGSQAQGLQTLGAARVDRHRAARAGLSPDLYDSASSADDRTRSTNRAASGPRSKTASS